MGKSLLAAFAGALVSITMPHAVSAQAPNPVPLTRLPALGPLEDLTTELKNFRVGVEIANPAGLPANRSALSTRAAEESINSVLREAARSQAVLYGDFNTKAIYGIDDRKDYNNSRLNASQRRAADATGILIKANLFSPLPNSAFSLPSGNVIDGPTGRGLCTPVQARANSVPEEPFYNQANPGFCSGFKVGADKFATAGHCIKTEADCASTKIVFGFHITDADAHPEQHIPKANVYSCRKIIGGQEQDAGADWRVIQVDRAIDAPQVELHQAAPPSLSKGDGVTVVGYPLGLPVKISDGAQVRAIASGFFVANLDTYEGNSGSAVFNTSALLAGRLLVEGVLVRGENDFAMTSPCFASKRCPNNGCRGEDVTQANQIHVAP